MPVRAFRRDYWLELINDTPLGITVCGEAARLTSEDALLDLWSVAKVPVVLFQGNVKPILKWALGMLDQNYTLRFSRLPCDVNTYLQKRGPEALGRSVAASVSLMDQLWSQTTDGLPRGSHGALNAIEAEMMRAIENVPDEKLWITYAQDIAERVDSLRSRPVVRSNGFSHHSTAPSSIRLKQVEKGLSLREAEIIARLASDPLGSDVERLSAVQVSPETRKIIAGISCLVGTVGHESLSQAISQQYGPAIERAQQTLHKAGLHI